MMFYLEMKGWLVVGVRLAGSGTTNPGPQGERGNQKGYLQEPKKPLAFPGVTRKRSRLPPGS